MNSGSTNKSGASVDASENKNSANNETNNTLETEASNTACRNSNTWIKATERNLHKRPHPLWQQPTFLNDSTAYEKSRSASWMELFFDLVYVVAVAEAAKILESRHGSFCAVLPFASLMFLIWITWLSITLYTDRFDNDDVVARLFMLAHMVSIAIVATHIDHGGCREGFAIGCGLLHVVMGLQYGRLLHPQQKQMPKRRIRMLVAYAASYMMAAALFGVSAFPVFHAPVKVVFWACAVVVDVAVSLYDLCFQVFPLSRDHWPERMGLFTIVVLGEMVVGTVHGVSSLPYFPIWPVTAGICLTFAVWWVYFEGMDHSIIESKCHLIGWIALHFPIVVGVTVLGPTIYLTQRHHFKVLAVRALLCGSMGLVFAGIAFIQIFLTRTDGHYYSDRLRGIVKLASAGVVSCLWLIDTPKHFTVPPSLFLLLVLLICIVNFSLELLSKAKFQWSQMQDSAITEQV